jgi:hypothetical protein
MSPHIPEIDGVPRPSDVGRLTARAEIEDVRRVYRERPGQVVGRVVYCADVEDYDSAEELGAARDLEHWGYDPFRDFEA